MTTKPSFKPRKRVVLLLAVLFIGLPLALQLHTSGSFVSTLPAPGMLGGRDTDTMHGSRATSGLSGECATQQLSSCSAGDTAVIIPWFQSTSFLRPLSNLYLTYHTLKAQKIPVYIAEIALDDKPFLFMDIPDAMHFRTNANVWHKENVFREAVKRLPPQFTKVVMLDKDVTFTNPTWLNQTSLLLDSNEVVQPYSTMCLRTVDFQECSELTESLANAMYNNCSGLGRPKTGICGSTGYVMAFHRDLVENLGIMEASVIGGGDYFFLAACLNISIKHIAPVRRSYLDAAHVPYELFKSQLHQYYKNGVRLAWVPDMPAFHNFHGPRQDRQYNERWNMITHSNFSLNELYKNEDGMWAMREPAKWYHIFQTFFEDRNEDAVVSRQTPTPSAGAGLPPQKQRAVPRPSPGGLPRGTVSPPPGKATQQQRGVRGNSSAIVSPRGAPLAPPKNVQPQLIRGNASTSAAASAEPAQNGSSSMILVNTSSST
jgi:hypothetical protein